MIVNGYLKDNPLCVYCKIEEKLIPATVVELIKPPRGNRLSFGMSATGSLYVRNVMIKRQ